MPQHIKNHITEIPGRHFSSYDNDCVFVHCVHVSTPLCVYSTGSAMRSVFVFETLGDRPERRADVSELKRALSSDRRQSCSSPFATLNNK